MTVDDFQKQAAHITAVPKKYKKTERKFYLFNKETIYHHFYNDLFIDACRAKCYTIAEYLLKNNLTEKDALVYSDLPLMVHTSLKNHYFHLTHIATAEKDFEALNLLKQYGADFSQTTDTNETPLQMHRRLNKTDCASVAKISTMLGCTDIHACTGRITEQAPEVFLFLEGIPQTSGAQRVDSSRNPVLQTAKKSQKINVRS